MSNIDFRQLITAEAKQAADLEARLSHARFECRRRILAICGETAQINLSAAASAGLLVEDDVLRYKAFLNWISEMRTAWSSIAQAGHNPSDDTHWPAVPAEAMHLIARF